MTGVCSSLLWKLEAQGPGTSKVGIILWLLPLTGRSCLLTVCAHGLLFQHAWKESKLWCLFLFYKETSFFGSGLYPNDFI